MLAALALAAAMVAPTAALADCSDGDCYDAGSSNSVGSMVYTMSGDTSGNSFVDLVYDYIAASSLFDFMDPWGGDLFDPW